MKRKFFLIFLCLLVFKVYSQTSQGRHPDLEPLFLPETVLDKANYSNLSADEIFKLALLYSECPLDSPQGQHCLEIFGNIKEEVTRQTFIRQDPEQVGRNILKLLYRDYLKTYSSYQTKINVALETGQYNCVSSALLYMAVAKAAGLVVRGQKTSEHAFCSVYVPGGKNGQPKKIDVETTNPFGFDPGSKEAIENESKIQGYYIVPKKYYSNRQEVSDLLFAGLIAGNLCSFYVEKNDYVSAVPLGAARYNALQLENNNSKAAGDVRREFDVLAANYVNIQPESAQDYSESLDWYRSFIDRWGMTTFLQKNMDNAFNNLMVFCFDENNYPLAAEALEKSRGYLSKNQLDKTWDILTDILVNSKIQGLAAEEQIEEIEELLSQGDLEAAQEKRALIYLENAWLDILNDCMSSRSYGTGYQKAGQALERLPQSTKIKRMQKSFYDNCIAIIHNNFATQANARNYEAAREVLEAGLQIFPDDRTLKNDLLTLNKMSGR